MAAPHLLQGALVLAVVLPMPQVLVTLQTGQLPVQPRAAVVRALAVWQLASMAEQEILTVVAAAVHTGIPPQ
jgi:hypothetical protein